MIHIQRPSPAPGQGHRIEGLWAWTVVDPLTDVEGIVAVRLGGRDMPAVGSMREIVERFQPFVDAVSREIEAPVRLRHFVPVED